jgi:hypothetical protein
MLSDRKERILCCFCLLILALFSSVNFPLRALSHDQVMHSHFISVRKQMLLFWNFRAVRY